MPLTREGKERSFNENLTLARTLPVVAGMVNVIGYLQLGFFTSHVTGRVSGFGVNLAKGKLLDAVFMLALVACFLIGAMSAGALVELAKAKHWPRYQIPLLIEALLLSVILLFEVHTSVPVAELAPSSKIWFAVAISLSMGLQNALVARLSGAVIRTTHLTGLSTDLGLELVRVARWYLDAARDKSLPERVRHLAEVRKDQQLYRVRLYVSILFSFMIGAVTGGLLSETVGAIGMMAPILILVALVIYDRVLSVSEDDLDENFNPTLEAKQALQPSAPASEKPTT